MAKPYSADLRRRVVGTIEGGTTIPEAAEQCGVSISSVVRFLKLHRETGSIDSAKFGGYKDFALAAHEDLVRQLVAEQPDITLAELEDRLTKKNITVGKSSISRFLHHLKLPFKKMGLQGIEWVILRDHSGGSMQVRTLRRRYSSSRSPYARLWKTRILLFRPSTNPSETCSQVCSRRRCHPSGDRSGRRNARKVRGAAI